MRKESGGERAEELMRTFEDAYTDSIDDFVRMQEFQDMYDNQPSATDWPTMSKMPIPLAFSMVEKALPAALDYLFPKEKFIRLNPLEKGADIESLRKAEQALEHTVLNRVKLKSHCLPTIKDCFKLGLGYGLVDQVVVTPPASVINQVFSGEREIASERTMTVGKPIVSPVFRYVSPGQVVVVKDGSDFNGINRVSAAFFVDFYNESDFRALFTDENRDGPAGVLSGTPEKYIEDARNLLFDSRIATSGIIATLGGQDVKLSSNKSESFPITIPVVKCYEHNRHTWIANGVDVIYEAEDKFNTLRCPLVKCSAWPDANRWYPMSSVEAAQSLSIGVNVWMNSMFDMMTHYVKPIRMYDTNMTNGRSPEAGPNGSIPVDGPIKDAVGYMQPPPAPSQIFNFGDLLQQMHGSSTGQESFMQSPQAGLLRSGPGAFESLLQSQNSREHLANAILETDFLRSAVEQILVLMQSSITEDGDVMLQREWNAEERMEDIKEIRVTPDDLVHAYDVELDLDQKHRNSAIDFQTRLQIFNALKGSPYVDQYELHEEFIGDSRKSSRLVLSKAKVAEIQEKDLASREAQGNLGVAEGESTQGEQAAQGAAAQGGLV